jgi:RHS repeat-associated protein
VGRSLRLLAFTMTVAVMAGLLAEGASAEPRPAPTTAGPKAQAEPLVPGRHARPVPPRRPSTPPWRPPAQAWPRTVAVDVPVSGRSAARAGALPLWIGAPSGGAPPAKVRVQNLRADGVLLRVARADGVAAAGKARITLDVRGFRSAYGGDWASRLRLWRVSDCTTPACRPVPLPSTLDHDAGTISADVALPGPGTASAAAEEALVTLAAEPAGAAGDFTATSLAPSASWSAGGNTGDFSWSYDLRVPPPTSGPAPQIALNYSSSSVDGRMAAANSQPSWIGEGFDWHPGFVERRYVACASDMGSGANNVARTGDLCWKTDNAFLSLPGHGGELIKDGTVANRWHLRRDDGTYVERRTGGPNGDNNGEWWVVRTTDGTQYWFGGRAGSQSTLNVPVFGNHRNEDCWTGAFGGSSCVQAYRWQLDQVVDRYGNTMRLSYTKETNRYGRNNNPADAVIYDRAGYLDAIEYGTRTDSTATAPYRVEFALADRCLANCADPASWPDVPRDLDCAASPCAFQQWSPTFYLKKRLSSVRTKVWDTANGRYRDVESWTLGHSYPNLSDSGPPVLWLERVSRAGLVGAATGVPDVTFAPVVKPNRVDTSNDQYPAMNRPRIQQIVSETGGVLDVTYSDADCVKGSRVPDKDRLFDNRLRCYPVRWTPMGHTEPIHDYFHKYLVTRVVESDKTADSAAPPRVVNAYTYEGDPAWHHTDDDGLISPEAKTWAVWRGYGAVLSTTGDEGEQTAVRTRYFRGMHGDRDGAGGTRRVALPGVTAGGVQEILDEDAFAGRIRERITYDGGAEVTATVFAPWQSEPTASRTVNDSTVHARYTGTGAEHSRTTLDKQRGHRTTTVRTTYDGYGMVTQVEDHGDDAVAGDEKCVRTAYARNTGDWIVDKVARERSYAVDCARVDRGGLTDEHVIADERTAYDGKGFDEAPTVGSVSKVDTLKAYNGGDPQFVTERSYTHDGFGRLHEEWDIRGTRTVHGYEPATGGPVTRTTVTRDLPDTIDGGREWKTTTAVDPAWGLPTLVTDPNGRQTATAYDGLGRTAAVWLPGRDRARWLDAPSLRYSYAVRDDRATVVTGRRLNPAGGYVTSYTFYDGLLRHRQTQGPDGAGKAGVTVVSDTRYDSAGRVRRVDNPYAVGVAPSATLYQHIGVIPSATASEYDGAGRLTVETHLLDATPASPGGDRRWQTTYEYGGDRTDITPPTGGTVSSTFTDARGQMVEERRYHPNVAAGSTSGYDGTTYRYNAKNQLVAVVGPTGGKWEYHYDVRGRLVRTVDPDVGTTLTGYDDADQVATRTDAGGVTLAYAYDQLGRPALVRDGGPTGRVRAEWAYDRLANGTAVLGQMVRSTRYVAAASYVTEVDSYNAAYQPLALTYRIPAAEARVDGTYTYTYSYHDDGSARTVRLPAAGDAAMETLTYGYDALGQATTLRNGAGALVTGTDYSSYGEIGAVHLRDGDTGPKVDITRTYETDTRRLKQIWTSRQSAPTGVGDVNYTYDPVGNLQKASDTVSGDNQCFSFDHQRRLTEAWTPAGGDCDTAPAVGALGGPARYWHSYEYDAAGNRKRMVERGTPAGDRTVTYDVQGGSHRLLRTSTSDNGGTRTVSYGHDATGNLASRPAPGGGSQTLKWDVEGRLATSRDATGETTMLYAGDGQRLVRRDPAGTTLYLPGQEVRATAAGARTVRYYSHAGQTVATRSGTALTWLAADRHGTAQFSVAAAAQQQVAVRRETPFGVDRAGSGTWPAAMDKGFVGGTEDGTGLTQLGAREYDPALGRFAAVDPLMDLRDQQQMNGYAYANNNPVTLSDPDGLIPRSCPDGECRHGQYGNSPGPATTYNPPVTPKPAAAPSIPKPRCPDGECPGARGGYRPGQSPASRFRARPEDSPFYLGLGPVKGTQPRGCEGHNDPFNLAGSSITEWCLGLLQEGYEKYAPDGCAWLPTGKLGQKSCTEHYGNYVGEEQRERPAALVVYCAGFTAQLKVAGGYEQCHNPAEPDLVLHTVKLGGGPGGGISGGGSTKLLVGATSLNDATGWGYSVEGSAQAGPAGGSLSFGSGFNENHFTQPNIGIGGTAVPGVSVPISFGAKLSAAGFVEYSWVTRR